MGRYSGRLAPLFADFAGVKDGASVLDVGCGPARSPSSSAAGTGPERVAAVDPAEQFVEMLPLRVPGADVGGRRSSSCRSATTAFDARCRSSCSRSCGTRTPASRDAPRRPARGRPSPLHVGGRREDAAPRPVLGAQRRSSTLPAERATADALPDAEEPPGCSGGQARGGRDGAALRSRPATRASTSSGVGARAAGPVEEFLRRLDDEQRESRSGTSSCAWSASPAGGFSLSAAAWAGAAAASPARTAPVRVAGAPSGRVARARGRTSARARRRRSSRRRRGRRRARCRSAPRPRPTRRRRAGSTR